MSTIGTSVNGPYVGALMRFVWQWVWERNYAGVADAGYNDITRAHVSMFRYPTLDWRRPTEIAEQLQISKQSVHELLTHLEQHGYLTREPDPSDGRARIVRLTTRGHELEQTINQLAHASELHIADLLGDRRFAQLRLSLEELRSKLSDE
ncbi:MAG: MarR family transcriptional regulator [Acidimicrobiales bacterium]